MDSPAEVREKNGFTLVDMTEREITVRLFQWRRDQPERDIDTLEPYHTYTVERDGTPA